jgi:ATP-dependent DNA helicase RecG
VSAAAAANGSTPVAELPGMNPPRARALERLGLRTAEDLLTHYPRRYEDRREFAHFPTAASEQPVCVCGLVVAAAAKRFRGRNTMFEATLQESAGHALSGRLTLRWFGLYYIQKIIATGQRLVVFGKPKSKGAQIFIDHPEFEVIEEGGGDEALVHLRRITPVYPATEGLSQRVLRGLIYRTLRETDLSTLPAALPAGLDPMRRGDALQAIHFPADDAERERARRHLVLSEFFGLQMLVAARRKSVIARAGQAHCGSGELLARFYAALPFALTGAQTRAVAEIRADLASGQPMNRLLQGDVGSGKTLVALSAMLLAVEAGYQAALMAPTQILAEQHYLTFTRWLAPLGLRIGLRTNARDEETGGAGLLNTRPDLAAATPGELALGLPTNGLPDIVIGTHALLYDTAPLPKLGLAVIDEQHKFGVLQRARFTAGHAVPPDVLVMTATPIPRTLAITVYGDLDVSILDEAPANRGRVITAVRPPGKLPEATDFIRKQLEAGRQAYFVYPLIEESDKLAAQAASSRFEYWREALKPFRAELLHGRLRPEEKDAIMNAFRLGKTHALVTTTVIEVGVDVKNANLMLIENAERFGLAQLHQLRGRIGRGEHKSYCLLIADTADAPEALEKLQILEKTSDGFQIAEADLRLRGAGDILGTAQSGLPPLKLGDLLRDGDLMQLARTEAREIFASDPELMRLENRQFASYAAASAKLLLAQVS